MGDKARAGLERETRIPALPRGEGCFNTAGGGGAFAEAVMSEGSAK